VTFEVSIDFGVRAWRISNIVVFPHLISGDVMARIGEMVAAS
jgi:hypothetical protein